MFCKIISAIVLPSVPMYYKFLKHLLVSQPVPFHFPFFESFGFMPEFTNQLSVLRGVADCLWSDVIKAGLMPIAVFIFLKVPHVSVSATEDTTLRTVLHSMWIGLFLLGLGFIDFGDV